MSNINSRNTEERLHFLLNLSDSIRDLTDVIAIQQSATQQTMDHFQSDRCYFCEIIDNEAIIRQDAFQGGLKSVQGQYQLDNMPVFRNVIDQGNPLIVADAGTSLVSDENLRALCLQLQVISFMNIPVIENGIAVGMLCIAQALSRAWTQDEIMIAQDVAERIWLAILRSRIEDIARKQQARQAVLLKLHNVLVSSRDIDHIQRYSLKLLAEHLKIDTLYYFKRSLKDEGWSHQIESIYTLGNRQTFLKKGLEIAESPDPIFEKFHAGKPVIFQTPPSFTIKIAERKYIDYGITAYPEPGWKWLKEDIALIKEVAVYAMEASQRIKAEKESLLHQQALESSERKYRTLFDSIDQGFCIIEVLFDHNNQPVDYVFQEANPAFHTLTGLKNTTGKRIRGMAPTLESVWFDIYGKIALTGVSLRFEQEAQALNHWYDVYAFRIGKPEQRRVAVLFTDIMDRKRAEEKIRHFNTDLEQQVARRTEQLRHHRDQLKSILDTTLVQMSVLRAVRDQHGLIVDFEICEVNRELETHTGRKDLVGKRYAEEYPGIREIGLFDLIVKAVVSGRPQQLEYFYVHEGFENWYTSMFVKFEDGVVATNMDITDRKRAEQERSSNLVLLEQSEDMALLGSWDFNRLTGVLTWSKGMYRLFEIELNQKIQPEIYITHATENSKKTAEKVVRLIREGIENFRESIEVFIGGHTKVLNLKGMVTQGNSGSATRVLGVDIDVTAARLSEARVKKLEAEQQREIFQVSLATLEEERHRISESLHNGIGQILYAVKMSLSRINFGMNEQAFKTTKKYTDELLTDAIKETRRISHELMPATLETFGLASALNHICQQFQDTIKFSCTITGLKGRLEKYLELAIYRTVQELMTNIMKHSGATAAFVRIEVDETSIQIVVSDNGRGMQRKVKGSSGIGLASIHSKIQLLNGTIDVISNEQDGTAVKIMIPRIT